MTAVVANALGAYSPTTGAVHAYTLTISRASAAPDGFSRAIIAVNGQSPGPLLTSGIGDTMQVTIQNQLDEPTSMHWHGILQTNSNDQDGAAGVNQRPIPAGASYTYRFVTNTPGTYWWGLTLPHLVFSMLTALLQYLSCAFEEFSTAMMTN